MKLFLFTLLACLCIMPSLTRAGTPTLGKPALGVVGPTGVAGAIAPSSLSPTPVVMPAQPEVVAPDAPLSHGKLVALMLAVAACFNVTLSGVQRAFLSLTKRNPGAVQKTADVVLSVAKVLGSNPDLK